MWYLLFLCLVTFLLGVLVGSRSLSVSPYLGELLGYFLLLASGGVLAVAALVLVVM